MSVPRIEIRPGYTIPRIIKGNWQIAGDHSASVIDNDEMYEHLAAFADSGVTAFDCGDIYYGVEERLGRFMERFRRERGSAAAAGLAVHTKFIPAFLQEEELRSLTRAQIEATIDRSLKRLRVERLDLVQFHWWNYSIGGSVETALVLEDLRKAGKIRHIGATNFNVQELTKIIDAGVDIVSTQVQYSLIDRRPQLLMERLCRERNILMLSYGGLGGGLFSRKWLGIADPGRPTFENVSLDKYYRIVVDFGGWDLFQALLATVDRIASKYGVGIQSVVTRYILDQPQGGAVIQGARHARHLAANLDVFRIGLDDEDRAAISAVLSRAVGPRGDCYDLDRDENRDATENVATEYFDVEDGELVTRIRAPVEVDEPYGHHIKH
mgnify:CR=1 FL=1